MACSIRATSGWERSDRPRTAALAASSRPSALATLGRALRTGGAGATLAARALAAHPPAALAPLPVAGLPEGAYTFETQVQLPDTTIVSTHPFRVGGVEQVAIAADENHR